MRTIRTLIAVLLAATALSAASCEKKGPAERAGEKIDNAGKKAADAVKDAGDKAADAVKDAGDKMKDAVDK